MTELNVVKRLKEIQRKIEELASKEVVIGPAGSNEDGTTYADLLAIHEFGAIIDHPGGTRYSKGGNGNVRFMKNSFMGPVSGVTGSHKIVIPERPVLRVTIANNKQAISNMLSKAISDCLRGNLSVNGVYDRSGIFVKNAVLDAFDSNELKPNSKATIRKKKSSKPLIDTGALRASINYEVRNRE